MASDTVCGKAIRQIEVRGWCQEHAIDSDGRVCIEQAINMSVRDTMDRDVTIYRVRQPMLEHLARTEHYPGDMLMDWNDAPGRTVDQVLGLLKIGEEAELSATEGGGS